MSETISSTGTDEPKEVEVGIEEAECVEWTPELVAEIFWEALHDQTEILRLDRRDEPPQKSG